MFTNNKEIRKRIDKLIKILQTNNLDCAILYGHRGTDHNIKYFCGYAIPYRTYVLVFQDKSVYILEPYFLVDYVKDITKYKNVKPISDSPTQLISELLDNHNARKIGLVDSDVVPFSEIKELENKYDLLDIRKQVAEIRAIKSKVEIKLIDKAYQKLGQALSSSFAHIQVGMTEKELAALIEYECYKQGADYITFPTTIFSGKRLDGRNVDLPTNRKFREDDIILVDAGASFDNYCADITRCIFIGSNKYLDTYKKLVEVQQEIITQLRVGISSDDVLEICEKELGKRSLLNFFKIRFVGHSIGTRFHENPNIKEGSDMILKEGHVFTVEPTLSKEDKFTFRVEDGVAMTKSGAVEFCHIPKVISITLEKDNIKKKEIIQDRSQPESVLS